MFPVVLTVTDTAGSTATATIEATVVAPFSAVANDVAGAEGDRLEFSGTFSDPATLASHSAVVFWCDCSVSQGTVVEADGEGTVTASHVYADDGA